MKLLWITAMGNYSPTVSYSAWNYCESFQQETIRQQFPIRYETTVYHLNRNPFANSFPSGMEPMWITWIGNPSPTVSYSAWNYCESFQQETIRQQFPIRYETTVYHLNRKPFANSFPSDMKLLCITSIGNLLPVVSHPTWNYCVSPQQETIRQQLPIRHATTVYHPNRKPFANSFLFDMEPM